MSESTQEWVAAGVRAVIGAHAQAQDAGRTDDIVALYTPDGVVEMPGVDPIEGHDAIRAAFKGWAPTQPQLHIVGNTHITSWSDNEARALSDVAFVQRGDSGWALQIVGHYDDTFRLQDGAWRLQRRSTSFQA